MAKVRVAAAARRDLKQIWLYIAEDSPDAADHLLDQFETTFLSLAKFSHLGRLREDLSPGLRSFRVGDYLIFYLCRKAGVTVVRVLSGYRDLHSLFDSPDR